jgi:hypothetical protein
MRIPMIWDVDHMKTVEQQDTAVHELDVQSLVAHAHPKIEPSTALIAQK